MRVRIRLGKGSKVSWHKNIQRVALMLASMLTPAALLASLLGFWRIASDLKWTSTFAISSGLFSHWQVWLGAAVLLQLCSRVLNRYGRDGASPAA